MTDGSINVLCDDVDACALRARVVLWKLRSTKCTKHFMAVTLLFPFRSDAGGEESESGTHRETYGCRLCPNDDNSMIAM